MGREFKDSDESLGQLAADEQIVPSERQQMLVSMPASNPTDDKKAAGAEQPVTIWNVVAVVVFYIFASISTILLNKSVLSVPGVPSLFFLWCQLIVAVVILQAARLFRLLSLPPTNFAALKQLSGLIAINVIGLTLNTLCLANMDAVLYQVARSLILPMTVSMAPFITGQYPSLKILGACALIFCGFIMGIFGEGRFNGAAAVTGTGILFGVLSSLSTSCHSFIIKGSFGKAQAEYTGTFDLVYYNNLFSAIFLLPILLASELGPIKTFYQTLTVDSAIRSAFLWGTLLSGASGLLINLAGFLQIRVTSPVTHTVSSAARGVLQTVAAHFVLGEEITLARCLGIAITLAGSCLYSVVKMGETQAQYKRIQS